MGKIEDFDSFNVIKRVDGANNNHDVQLITISTCIWCKKLKNLLVENNIAYDYIDIDTLPFGEKERLKKILYTHTEYLGFPMCFINGELIKGYKETQIMNKLKGGS